MRRRKTRRTVNKKRVGLLFGVIALVWMGISALHLTNPYLRSADFVEVSVAHGESVWSIAQTYSAKESTAKDLEEAIIEVNDLPPDGTIHVGRHLRIPVIAPSEQLQAMAEEIMLGVIKEHLTKLSSGAKLMFKFTIPSVDDLYADLMKDPHVVRIVALSGGYSQSEANEKLARNHGLIASFSRALAQDLRASQSDAEFDAVLEKAVDGIYAASIT